MIIHSTCYIISYYECTIKLEWIRYKMKSIYSQLEEIPHYVNFQLAELLYSPIEGRSCKGDYFSRVCGVTMSNFSVATRYSLPLIGNRDYKSR